MHRCLGAVSQETQGAQNSQLFFKLKTLKVAIKHILYSKNWEPFSTWGFGGLSAGSEYNGYIDSMAEVITVHIIGDIT